jgi:hypothetical protein
MINRPFWRNDHVSRPKTTLCVALAASLAWYAGCRQEPAPAPPAPAPTAPPADPAQPSATETQQGANAAESARIEAAFASLSAGDRALAAAQKICPVSGEALGGMGTPIKVSVAGHEVFVCCESCKDPLVENPAEHLAKIGLKPAGETLPQ